jgi:hypothetical protein
VSLNQLQLHEEKAVEAWRREWSRFNTNTWTRRLIEDASSFRKRKRSIDHFTMKLWTGHGIFNRYRVMINKKTVFDKWWHCNASPDDTEHALLRCPRWTVQRTTLENMTSDTFTADNIIALVLANDHTWGQFWSSYRTIMKARQAQEIAKVRAGRRGR